MYILFKRKTYVLNFNVFSFLHFSKQADFQTTNVNVE